jgi:hypothetical protein
VCSCVFSIAVRVLWPVTVCPVSNSMSRLSFMLSGSYRETAGICAIYPLCLYCCYCSALPCHNQVRMSFDLTETFLFICLVSSLNILATGYTWRLPLDSRLPLDFESA